MKLGKNWVEISINNFKKNEILWKKFLQMLYKFIISSENISEILKDFENAVIDAINEMDNDSLVDWLNQEGINLEYNERNKVFWITTIKHFDFDKAKELILEKLNIPITDENIEKLETWLEKMEYWAIISDLIIIDFEEFYKENNLGEIFYDLNWENKIGFSEENAPLEVFEIDQNALNKIVFEKILDYDSFEEEAEELIASTLKKKIYPIVENEENFIEFVVNEIENIVETFTDFLETLLRFFKEKREKIIEQYVDEIIYLDKNSEDFKILKQLQEDFIAWIEDFPEWFSEYIIANYEDDLRAYLEEDGESEEEE
jgi:hypothetical protein